MDKNKKATPKKKKRVFNLLKPIVISMTIWDSVYDWILSRAKTVIIFAEVLVVVAFFSKFIVDQQAKTKETYFFDVLQVEEKKYQDSLEESLFRTIIDKGRSYRVIWEESSNQYTILNEVLSYIPETSEELEVSIAGNQLTVNGYNDLNVLQEIETKIKSSTSFENAKITDLSVEGTDIQDNKGRYSLSATIIATKATRTNLQ